MISLRSLLRAVTGVFLGSACILTAKAQSSDALLDKLVEKGILSVKEANDLREETDKDFNKAYSLKSGMPDWVQSMKWNGDFRARYEGIFFDNGPLGPEQAERDRFRYRARLGAAVAMSDNFEVGLRLGSGELSATPSLGGSAFSANTTMNGDATRKAIFVDLAYAKWTPCDWAEAQVGKMNNLFWTSGMLFDPDYNPEGAQQQFRLTPGEKHTINFTLGEFVIAENFSQAVDGTNADTYLFVDQVDWTAKWTPQFSTRLGAGAYFFANQSAIPFSLENDVIGKSQNGTPAVGPGSQEFNPIFTRAEATYTLSSFPLFSGEFPITVAGEYANNPAASDAFFAGKNYSGAANQAYEFGVTFGSSKLKHNWLIGYEYRYIETAAVWRGLTDDDFGWGGKGGTDSKGHVIGASYHAFDPLYINFRAFLTEQINNEPTMLNKQTRVQADLLFVF